MEHIVTSTIMNHGEDNNILYPYNMASEDQDHAKPNSAKPNSVCL